MSNTDATMLSGRHRPIRRSSKARRFFEKQFWTPSSEPFVDGDVHEARHLRVIPLTDGDVGHYDKEPGESSPLDIFDRLCDAEGLNISPSSHEFSNVYF